MMPLKTEFPLLFLRVFSFGDTILHGLCPGQTGAKEFFQMNYQKGISNYNFYVILTINLFTTEDKGTALYL
jgi:hypothetical protein